MAVHKRKIQPELKWLVFVLPALVFYLIFFIIPSLRSVYYSLTDWDGVNCKFIGLSNFTEMIHDSMIITSFGNTALYAVCITVIQNVLGLLLAIFMVKKLTGVNIMRTLFFMPYIFSTLLLGYVWGFILEPNIGVVNNLLDAIHLDVFKMGWLSDPFWGRWMIILITIWQCIGYSMVIYIAGLNAIPADLFESAEIDGAKAFSRFANITFPLIAPAFTINIMLSVIGSLKIFDQVYALTNGGPGFTTNSIATMIYQLGFGTGVRWGYGTAMAMTLFAFILILTVLIVPFLRKREVDM